MIVENDDNEVNNDIKKEKLSYDDLCNKYDIINNNIDVNLPEYISKDIDKLNKSYNLIIENKQLFISQLPNMNSNELKENTNLIYDKLKIFNSDLDQIYSLLNDHLTNLKNSTGIQIIFCWPFFSDKEKLLYGKKLLDKNMKWQNNEMSKIIYELNKINEEIIAKLQTEIQKIYPTVNLDITIEEYMNLIISLLQFEGNLVIDHDTTIVDEKTLKISEMILYKKNMLDIKEKFERHYILEDNTIQSMLNFLDSIKNEYVDKI